MAKRKTPEQLADEERRYRLARTAATLDDFAALAADPNQAIRASAVHNGGADAAALALFLRDRFWGVRIEIAHEQIAERILREAQAMARLEQAGVWPQRA